MKSEKLAKKMSDANANIAALFSSSKKVNGIIQINLSGLNLILLESIYRYLIHDMKRHYSFAISIEKIKFYEVFHTPMQFYGFLQCLRFLSKRDKECTMLSAMPQSKMEEASLDDATLDLLKK